MENIDSDRGDSVKIIDRTILALHPVSIGILSLSLQPIHTPFESNRIWNITEYSEFLINHPLGVPGGISGLVSARVPGGLQFGTPLGGVPGGDGRAVSARVPGGSEFETPLWGAGGGEGWPGGVCTSVRGVGAWTPRG